MYSLSQASQQRRSEEDYEANPSPQMLVSDQNTRGDDEATTTHSQTQDCSREKRKGNNKKKPVDDNITPPGAPDTGYVTATTTLPPFARNSYGAHPQDCVVKQHAAPVATESFIPAISSPDTPVPTRKSRIGLPHGVAVGAIRVAGSRVDDANTQDNDSLDICSEANDPSTYTPLDTAPTAESPLIATCVSDTEADIEAQVQSRMQNQARDIAHLVRKELMTNAAIPVEVQPSLEETSSVATNEHSVHEEDAKKKKICIVAIVLLAIVAAVGAGIGIAVSKKPDEAEAPTPSPITLRSEVFQDFLAPISGELLNDTTSPQFQALNWLANNDAANMTIGVDSEAAIKTRYVAAVLYYAFGGDNWTNNYKFLSDRETCSWNQRFGSDYHGINCSSDGTAQSFHMPANNLVGSIPREIGYYTNLNDLDLSDNMISGSIASLVNLAHLGTLNCSLNALTGTLPNFLFTHRSLKYIDLGHNRFFASISDSLGKSDQLLVFHAHNNSLTGTIPSAVGQSWVIGSLSLSSNQLVGTIPEFVSISRIWGLGLGNNMLTGTIPTTIGSLSLLEYFQLDGNGNDGTGISGRIPSELGKCQNLYYLSLDNNTLAESIPTELGSLSSLQTVSMWNNNLTGNIPAELGNTPLRYVYFGSNNLTGEIGSVIDSLPHSLEFFSVRRNQLQGTIPTSIGSFLSLENIDFGRNDMGGSNRSRNRALKLI
jgi:hypothetical protein